MAYCGPRGIPLSQFLSWPQSDQDAALGWAAHEAQRCQGCGTHPDDWNEKAGGSRVAYHAEIRECEGCVHLQRTRESERLSSGKERGLHVRLAVGSFKACTRCRPPQPPR